MDVISGEFIDRTSTTELDDLSRFLPNVVIQEQGVSLPSFNIRGITDDSASITTTPRISVYQDGIDISKKTVSSVGLFDVERIEVLKGAQPTLFGAAANGAVSIISAQPEGEFDASARFSANSLDGEEFRGMVNMPINDIFAFRLAGMIREQDGTIDNLAFGPGSYNPSGVITGRNGVSRSCGGGDLNGVSVESFRATLKADFDDTSVLLRAAVETNNQPGISFKSGSIAPRSGNTNPFSDAELGLGSLVGIDRDLESFDFAGSTETGARFDYGGNTFRLVPEVSGALFLNKSFTINGYGLEFELISSYQSEIFFDSSNRPELEQDAYLITDASIKFGNDNSFWRVELFADNIFDEEYLIDAGNSGGGLGIPTVVAGLPFIAGVRLYADY